MKISDKIQAQAQEIILTHGYPKVFVNSKGEFFSNENLALNSVGNKRKDIVVIEAEPKEEPTALETKQKELEAAQKKLEAFKANSTDCLSEEELTQYNDELKGLALEVEDLTNEVEELEDKEA